VWNYSATKWSELVETIRQNQAGRDVQPNWT